MAKTAETTPRPRPRPPTSKWKGMYEDLAASGKKSMANLREKVAKAEETGEVVTVVGGIGAGLLDAADIEVVMGGETDDPMAIPGGLVAGPLTYVAGRYMKSPLLRKAGVGLTTGGAALLTAERARPWFAA